KRDWSSDVCSSDLLLWFSLGVKIFEIRNRFSGLRMLPPPGSNGSFDTESLSRSGYFHTIPAVSLKSFWRHTAVCSLLLLYISLYGDSLYSLRIRRRLLRIHSRFYSSAFSGRSDAVP